MTSPVIGPHCDSGLLCLKPERERDLECRGDADHLLQQDAESQHRK